MSNAQITLVGDRKTAIREYAKSLAKTDKRLSFTELGETMGLELRSDEHRQAHSVYCASRNAEAVAWQEKARSLGLTMDSVRETTDKETGKVKSISINWNVAKTPKAKTPKVKSADILTALKNMSAEDRKALLASIA